MVNSFMNSLPTCHKPEIDYTQRFFNNRDDAGLLLHFAQGRFFWSFTLFNMSLWQRPENSLAGRIFKIATADKQAKFSAGINDKSTGADFIYSFGINNFRRCFFCALCIRGGGGRYILRLWGAMSWALAPTLFLRTFAARTRCRGHR